VFNILDTTTTGLATLSYGDIEMKEVQMSDNNTEPKEGLHQVQETWSLYSRLSQNTRSKLRSLWQKVGFNEDVASKLRYETEMAFLRGRCALSRRHKRQAHELAGRKHLQLHLGCGNALLPGWINMDCYPPEPIPGIEMLVIDMRCKWPIADESAKALFSEHFLEHLPFKTVSGHILQEMKRTLEPGGRIRIGVPNGEYFIEQYIASKNGTMDPLYNENRQDTHDDGE
jgi:ribosomal protein L32